MQPPNIIVILADDMGYGDWGRNNRQSKIPTPNLDRLADEGMRFSDAHAASAVCTPSRYALLTGRYCWRSRLKNGIVWHWDGALIEPDRRTIGNLLQEAGYATECVGKWHLGWDWALQDGSHPNDHAPFGELTPARKEVAAQVCLEARIGGGPVDRGFDHYFGVDVPNFPPYTWFQDAHLDPLPTVAKPKGMYGSPGLAAEGWVMEEMLPAFTRRAVEGIHAHAAADRPFFLYFPLTAPHSPVVPNAAFHGKSGAGRYGDFVCEVDDVVGQVMRAVDAAGIRENTLILFTSDNGPEHRMADDEGVYERMEKYGHASMGNLRGIKRDVWEGGHRVPFVARWPKRIASGTVCDRAISLADLMATCAEISGVTLHDGEAEDSISFLPLLEGCQDVPLRPPVILHSVNGKFGIRQGDWVFIDDPSGGDNQPPQGWEPEWYTKQRGYTAHDQPGELFNLKEDATQRMNRYAEEPERVKGMKAALAQIRGDD